MMTIDQVQTEATRLLQIFIGWLVSPQFSAQIGAIVIAMALAHLVNRQTKGRTTYFRIPPDGAQLGVIGSAMARAQRVNRQIKGNTPHCRAPPDGAALIKEGRWIYSARDRLFPAGAVLMLASAVQRLDSVRGTAGRARIAQSIG